jgi:flagellar assembly protein FliH
MSSKKASPSKPMSVPVAEFLYRQTASPSVPVALPHYEAATPPFEVQMSQEELQERLAIERAAGGAESIAKLRQEFEERADRETTRITIVVEEFAKTRKEYFSLVEAEVVRLALAIAAKILHRESQVDPLLVAAIVQVALGQLKEGAAAVMRVRPEDGKRWRDQFDAQKLGLAVIVTEDEDLAVGDCILESDLGTVNFSLDVQLKEVEQGFFDVLAQRPQV